MGRAGAGYMHRGYEKLTEVRTFPQVTTLINRIDWLGSFANEVPFILAAEKLMEHRGAAARPVDPHDPVRAAAASPTSALFLGDIGVQLGAITPVFYAFRDREYVLNLIEAATGGRFHPNFDRIGGLKDDLPEGWIDETKQVMKKLRDVLRRDRRPAVRQRDLPEPHPRHRRHPRRGRPAVRPVAAPTCAPAASTGTCAATRRCRWRGTRSTGRSGPTPTATASPAAGCACRRRARPPRSSTSCSTRCPAGPIMAKVPRIIKVPEGEAWVSTENPLGEMGYYVVSKGDLGPFRVKIRSASFNNISIVPWVLRGVYVPDVITILACLYFILGDIDR